MDNIRKLEQSRKGWWSLEEISSLLSLSREATAVFCSRSVRRGDLVRARRGLYLLPGWLTRANEPEIFRLSNLLQSPSYISLLTALSFHGVSTQMERSACESIGRVRGVKYEVDGFLFRYRRLPEGMFTGFSLQDRFFIATPEKALADLLYLTSLGRAAIDQSAIDLTKIKKEKLREFLKFLPQKSARFAREKLDREWKGVP